MRFKTTKGKLMVIPPGAKPEVKPVNLIYDETNQTFGIQSLDGDLKGYCFFVSQAALKACRDNGSESETLKGV